jgi:hypothetical protein
MTFLHDTSAAEQAAPSEVASPAMAARTGRHARLRPGAGGAVRQGGDPGPGGGGPRAEASRRQPLGFEERVKRPTPCPLLRDDLCLVYAARPATCRTAVSRDVAACERAFRLGSENEEIPTPTFYIEMRAGYSLALAGALRRAGFPAAAYEYNAALNAALGAPDAEAAWLAGEDIFAGIACDPSGDPFDRAGNRRIYDAAWVA